MIAVIFDKDTTDFTGDGIGRLPDILLGNVHESLNGMYEAVAKVPESAQDADKLKEQNILWVKSNDKVTDGQPFRIYRIVENAKDHTFHVYTRHLLYDLSGYPVLPFETTGVLPALTGLSSHSAVQPVPFNVWSDIENTATAFKVTVPQSVRACLGGTEGSILQTFGGEFEWDVDTVKLHAHRGEDQGIEIRYAKNLTAFEIDRQTVAYTGCLAYYKTDTDYVAGTVQQISNPEDFPTSNIFVLDCSGEFDSVPSADQLNTRAQQYMTANGFGIPFRDSLKISFVPLWQTEEYKNFAALERVGLGDWVHVLYKDYDLKMQIIDYVYDWTHERYVSLTLGNKKASLSEKIVETVKDETEGQIREVTSFLDEALDHAQDVMSGATGGYIYIGRDADGHPNEIYILDTPSLDTATNILRMNYAGIAFSQTGINGQFTTAWTIDSHFVADFITAGTIDGGLIRGESIIADALEANLQNLINQYTMNFKFANDGLHIAKQNQSGVIISRYNSLFTDQGMRVIETLSNVATLIAEGDTVTARNLTAQIYLRMQGTSAASRIQEFHSSIHGTENHGIFWEN